MNSLFYLDGRLFIECNDEELEKYKYLDHVLPTDDPNIFNYVPAETHNLTREQYEELKHNVQTIKQINCTKFNLIQQRIVVNKKIYSGDVRKTSIENKIKNNKSFIKFYVFDIINKAKQLDLECKIVKVCTTKNISDLITSSDEFDVIENIHYGISKDCVVYNVKVNKEISLVWLPDKMFIDELEDGPIFTLLLRSKKIVPKIFPKVKNPKIKINYKDYPGQRFGYILGTGEYYLSSDELHIMYIKI